MKDLRQYRIIQVCGLRSKIFRQKAQIIGIHTDVCMPIFRHSDGIRFKQGVRRELCGVALIKSIAIALVITILFTIIPFSAQCENISNEVFRLHILADNDSQEAQSLKLKVRDEVLKLSEKLYKHTNTLSGAELVTSENLQQIADMAQKTVFDNGYTYPVKAEIKKMYFNTRRYGKVTMPAGFYNALRITIGEGRGKNWWCVMYPSLCVGASTNYEALRDKTSDAEYNALTSDGYELRFKIVEYFNNFCSIFS